MEKKEYAIISKEAYIRVDPQFEIIEIAMNSHIKKNPILQRIEATLSDFTRRAVVGYPVIFVVITVPLLNHACRENVAGFHRLKWVLCIGEQWGPRNYTMSVSCPKAIPELFLL
jgi:hypothetical protein